MLNVGLSYNTIIQIYSYFFIIWTNKPLQERTSIGVIMTTIPGFPYLTKTHDILKISVVIDVSDLIAQ